MSEIEINIAVQGSFKATIKKIGMGLNVFFILTLVAVGSMLWGGIKKMISN